MNLTLKLILWFLFPEIMLVWYGWKKFNYVNPPYSNKVPWIKKAIEEQKKGNKTVMLLPAATDAAWFHDLVVPNFDIEFMRGRLKLDNGKHPKYGSMLITTYYNRKVEE